jgi:hypothetical protein
MRYGVVHQLDSRSSTICNYVSSDVWFAVHSVNEDAIVRTLFDSVPPNQRHASGFVVVTHKLHAILVALCNNVIKNLRLVVLDLNAECANLNFVLNDVCINIDCRDDGTTLAKANLVALDLWLRSSALYEDSSCIARHDDVF